MKLGTSEGVALDYQMLGSVWKLKLEYEREIRRLEDLKFLAHPSTPLLDGMPHATSIQSKVEKIAMLIVEAEQSLKRLAEQLEAQKFLLLTMLNQSHLKELPQRVLNYHYVGCQSFNAIAKLLSYSRGYIIKLHDAGLRFLGLDVRTMIHYKKNLRAGKSDIQLTKSNTQLTAVDIDNTFAIN